MKNSVTLKILRFDPEKERKPHFKEYKVPVEKNTTVLQALIYIKENIDPTLSFRAFCRSGICGSCSMKINGKSLLACKTKIENLEKITVEPLDRFRIIKDLTVDIEGKTETIKRFRLWLEEKNPPEKEFPIKPEEVKTYEKETDCILCLSCCNVCETLKENIPYPGPFAFVKMQRFLSDSREKDESKNKRIDEALNASIWSCVQCQKCVSVCPKGISPAKDIQKIRNATVKAGKTETPGAKKLSHFINWIYATGQINRLFLPADVYDNKKAVEEFIKTCEKFGIKIWEIPHLPDNFLALRDLIIRTLLEEGNIKAIDFKKIRKIDKKIEKLLKGEED